MTGDNRIRHCAECNLDVYNLSAMTPAEVENLVIRNRGRRLCGRFFRRADGTVLTQDCPRGLREVVRRVSRVAGAALAAMMSFSLASAQNPSPPAPQSNPSAAQQTGELIFTVADPQGAIIPGVEVVITRKQSKELDGPLFRSTAKTDSNGRVQFSHLPVGNYLITAHARGFQSFKREISVSGKSVQTERVPLAIRDTDNMVIVGEIADPLMDMSSSTVITLVQHDLQNRPINPGAIPGRGPAVPLRQ